PRSTLVPYTTLFRSSDRHYVPAIARIEQVRNVLGEVLQWQHPADQVLSRWMRAHPRLGARDRAEVTDAVFNVLRHLRLYRNFSRSEEHTSELQSREN